MNPFLYVGGYAINPDMVQFVDLRSDDTATVHLGPNSLIFSGLDAEKVRAAFTPPVELEEQPEETAEVQQ